MWSVEGRALHARIGIGRPRRGKAWMWLPDTPVEVDLDGQAVQARSLGDGVYCVEICTGPESDLAIRW